MGRRGVGKDMRIASVDIGTNTIRLLIADVNGKIEFITQKREIVRLGEGISVTGRLSQAAIERALGVLKRYKRLCVAFQVDLVIPVATSAVREASNREEFLAAVKKETGWDVRVISGDEEARLTYLGVKHGLNIKEPFVVFDIGGGSTEYICVCGKLKIKSLPIGVVKLTEDYIKHDPPLDGELEKLRKVVRGFLNELGDFEQCKKRVVVGTAGTATTLAAIDLGLEEYDVQKVHGYKLSLDRIEGIYHRLRSIPSSERLKIPGMEKGREDLIISGIIITIETLNFFESNFMIVSEWGIREGVILDAAGYR